MDKHKERNFPDAYIQSIAKKSGKSEKDVAKYLKQGEKMSMEKGNSRDEVEYWEFALRYAEKKAGLSDKKIAERISNLLNEAKFKSDFRGVLKGLIIKAKYPSGWSSMQKFWDELGDSGVTGSLNGSDEQIELEDKRSLSDFKKAVAFMNKNGARVIINGI